MPFGGSTSVVESTPRAGSSSARLARPLAPPPSSVDERSLTARLEPGLRGPEAERELAARGVTLGHFPQSFEYATVGGFAATRSAARRRRGYGRFDSLVT